MFNIKWGFISGGSAFLLSLVLGGFSGVAFGYVLLRAGIFLVIFFAAGLGLNMVINSYFPELLNMEPLTAEDTLERHGGEGQPGSRINITLGEGEGALPEMYQSGGGSEEVGNINDLITGAVGSAPMGAAGNAPENSASGQGIDQPPQDGYTNQGGAGLDSFNQEKGNFADGSVPDGGAFDGAEVFQPAPAYSGPVFTSSPGDGDLGDLPDLDAMAGAFLTSDVEERPVVEAALEVSLPAKSGGGKTQALEGDFSPKDLAAGIQTILSKEKQG